MMLCYNNSKKGWDNMSIYDFEVTEMSGEKVSLSKYKDQVILIVNTASKCGFTKQLTGLEELYKKYEDQGFVVLGFPCNQFLAQDPKSNEAINEFCQINYGVTFKMHEKIKVNGRNADPLYQYLVAETDGKKIPWNFTKFLINRDGVITNRFEGKVEPESFEKDIVTLLD